jgi:hypothetical protein
MEVTCTQRLPTKFSDFEVRYMDIYTSLYRRKFYYMYEYREKSEGSQI